MTFFDASTRHAIYIERYKKRLVRDILERINELTDSLFNRVSASDLENMTRRDLNRLLSELRGVVIDGYQPINQQVEAALREFAVYEADWQATNLTRSGLVASIGAPSDADLWATMYARPFQGKLLREWLADLPANTTARVRQTIRQGYVDGLGALEIARQIRGTRGQRGVMDISARGAEAMVRTAVAHTASTARDRTYRQSNKIEAVQWLSVLDHRTSNICRNNDGRVGPVRPTQGWKPPRGFQALKPQMARPPAHIGCRSTVVPITEGNRAALLTRATYNDWLSRQPESVQDDILGPTRGRLYREGGYTVDRFTDPTGKEYTLDELRSKDAETFSEIFGD